MRGYRIRIGLVTIAAALAACAPAMPEYPSPRKSVWLDQGWTPEQRYWFHGADQGTLTFGIPYEWFIALEQPTFTLGEAPLLSDKAYLNRFGFIPGESRLPVGFARGVEYRDPGTPIPNNAAAGPNLTGIGLTCAACHTGRLTYKDTEYLIDGGSALTDAVGFNEVFVLSMLYTKYDPFRFNRFAARVLGAGAGGSARDALRAQFRVKLQQIVKVAKLERATRKDGTTEGFGRLDALNRIGNRVFGVDMRIDANYVPRTAPVHYPHIWNTPWFTWVQYNGSIMQPMVRNAGEALGVGAKVDLTGSGTQLFDSTVQVGTLHRIENTIAGQPPFRAKAFSGLRSPVWPDALPPIDPARAARGAGLYKELCQGCHLPAPNTKEFWSGAWWAPAGGKGEWYLDLIQKPVAYIGTDPAQAAGMAARTVALSDKMESLPDAMKFKSNGFGPALGQMVQNVTSRWYDSRSPPVPKQQQDAMNGERPNMLRAPLEYKARPLNGIWATPPYLHNGSVPSLYALLSPLSKRPTAVHLGDREYDPVNVGYKNEAIPGGFALDTSKPGNRNTGHEFRDGPRGGGVIGRGLSDDERFALIEYLKTL